ncbi:MAG: ATP-dependent 6-phosphofructokinase, partial [Oscillospiraceae bacterium]|jgi:6-phosphofructokinase 1|nr:ATP-dependent 6-phosphofructokinase [Oscillospiraceae bacterium]
VFAVRARGMRIYGIQQGYQGLYDANWDELTLERVAGIQNLGGTILRTARFEPFNNPETRADAIQTCLDNCAQNRVGRKRVPIQGLIVVGGDGSFRGARDLSAAGLPCVCLPATIDNDIACTDYTIGYDTCLNTMVDLLTKISDTARAHDRCMVVEVMGNKAGDLTLYGAMAAGATAAIVMEYDFDRPAGVEMTADELDVFHQKILAKMRTAKEEGQTYFVFLIAEGITYKRDKATKKTLYPGGITALAAWIEAQTGIMTRADVLGYAQRGGSPSARDRILATQMGDYAVDLLKRNRRNRVVVIKQEKIRDMTIEDALDPVKTPKVLSQDDFALQQRMSPSFSEVTWTKSSAKLV